MSAAAITDPHSDRYRRLTDESRVAKPRFPRAFSGHSCDRVFDKIKGIQRFIFHRFSLVAATK